MLLEAILHRSELEVREQKDTRYTYLRVESPKVFRLVVCIIRLSSRLDLRQASRGIHRQLLHHVDREFKLLEQELPLFLFVQTAIVAEQCKDWSWIHSVDGRLARAAQQ